MDMRSRFVSIGIGFLGIACLGAVLGFGVRQADTQQDGVSVGKLLQGMGYELKTLNAEAGKEKYEFTIVKGGLDIPVASEVSTSKNYVWLTIYFGEAPTAATASGAKMHALLNWNFKVQPGQFYITDKGSLMMAYAIDNRNVTPAIMRRVIDKLVDDAVRSKDAWVNGGK